MTDKVTGFLEVGLNDNNEIILNHPAPLELDENGIGHFVFSANQAKHLAKLLLKHAAQSEENEMEREAARRRARAAEIPVDRSQRVLVNGQPVTDDHRTINPATGMQKDYVCLSAEERAKGFVRPVRRTYRHLTCGANTTMAAALAETYARDPTFYSGTFCVNCREHRPLNEFVWEEGGEVLGS